MPGKKMRHATTPAQQRLMGAALAAKRGEAKPASKAIAKVARGMSESQLKEFATKPKGGYKKK
jgi:uncharacterized protein DUF3008